MERESLKAANAACNMIRESYEMKPSRPTRRSFFFGGQPQEELRKALQDKYIDKFKKLVKVDAIDLEHVYKAPDNKTCLEIATSEPDREEFIKCLLGKEVKVNEINVTYGFAPIHFAIESGNIKALQTLLDDDRVDVNVKSKGNTALLMAIKKIEALDKDCTKKIKNYEDMIKLLLEKGCNANSPDLKGVTPIHSASKQRLETVIKLLDEFAKKPIDIDFYKDPDQNSARDVLKNAFPHLVNNFGGEEVDINVDKLFYYLSKEDKEENFILGIKRMAEKNEHNSAFSAHNGLNTLLQFSTEKGMDKAVNTLLEFGADPNLTFSGNPNKPIAIACQYGYKDILKIFIDHEKYTFDSGTADSLLQIIVKGMQSYHKNEEADHKGCLKLLLDNKSKININVNHVDIKHNTALYYAARNGDQEIVIELLRNGAYVGLCNKFNEPLLAEINAKTLEAYLDECITTNGQQPSHDNYEIRMQFRFLVYPNNSIENKKSEEPLMDNFNTRNNVKEVDTVLARETDALLYMTRNEELHPLFKHPIISSFIYLKWQRIKMILRVNFLVYFLFWFFLILYILLGKTNQSDSNGILYIGTVFFLILLTLRELFQLLVSTTRYLLSFENLMEVILICVTAAIVFNSVEEPIKQQLSAVAILLSSAELVLLLGRFPNWSTNIVMLKTVTRSYFKLLLWYCILIIAFALSFYTLFKRQKEEYQTTSNFTTVHLSKEEEKKEDFFEDPYRSLFKTIVMLTGEFDTSSIEFNTFPVMSHLIFIVFVFMVPIVLFNLLNGLAVGDTQKIRADAELYEHMSRVKLISFVESILIGNVESYYSPSWCWSYPLFSFINLNVIKHSFIRIKALERRISLFPNFLPQYRIIVKPNKKNKIVIPGVDALGKCGGSCYFELCKNYKLDSMIVKQAKAVISKKTTVSEYDDIKKKLSQYEKKFDKLESWLKNVLVSGSGSNK